MMSTSAAPPLPSLHITQAQNSFLSTSLVMSSFYSNGSILQLGAYHTCAFVSTMACFGAAYCKAMSRCCVLQDCTARPWGATQRADLVRVHVLTMYRVPKHRVYRYKESADGSFQIIDLGECALRQTLEHARFMMVCVKPTQSHGSIASLGCDCCPCRFAFRWWPCAHNTHTPTPLRTRRVWL